MATGVGTAQPAGQGSSLTTTQFAQGPAGETGHGKAPPIAAGFLPVQVTADRRPEGGRGVELLLADGRVLRLHLGFDRQTLLDVLGVLEGRGC